MATKKVLNFGSLNIDYVYQVDDFVAPGETKLSANLTKFGGGKGNNQSIALARAGAKVYHAGAIGQDGIFLKDNLDKENINTDFICISDITPTGHAIIQVNTTGENCILLHGGANQTISDSYIQQVFEGFTSGDILLIQNEVSNIDKIIKTAGAKQMQIYFNPAPMSENVLSYPLDLVDTFILNQAEAASLTNSTSTEQMLNKLAGLFPNSKIILTLGKDGVIYQTTDQASKQIKQIKQSSYKVNAIDTTAAGDTFIGYFIACIQKDLDITTALELSCKAAAIAVTRHGATTSIPYISEIDKAEIS